MIKGCQQGAGSNPENDNAGCTSMKESKTERKRLWKREQWWCWINSDQCALSSLWSQWEVTEMCRCHTRMHTCAKGSTKILYSAHQKSHEDTYLLMCGHSHTHTQINSTQPTCVDNRRKEDFCPSRRSLEELPISTACLNPSVSSTMFYSEGGYKHLLEYFFFTVKTFQTDPMPTFRTQSKWLNCVRSFEIGKGMIHLLISTNWFLYYDR